MYKLSLCQVGWGYQSRFDTYIHSEVEFLTLSYYFSIQIILTTAISIIVPLIMWELCPCMLELCLPRKRIDNSDAK